MANSSDWNITAPSPNPNNSHWHEKYSFAITTIGVGLTTSVCILGSIGNFLSIWVMVVIIRRDKVKRAINFILTGLVTCDGLLLVLTLFVNIISNGLEYTRLTFTIYLYQYNGYISVALWPVIMILQVASINLTVLTSYERWLAVCRPLRFYGTRYNKRILALMALSLVESVIYNMPRWWEYEHYSSPISLDVKEIVCPNPNVSCPFETIVSFRKSEFGKNIIYRYFYSSALYAIFVFLLPFICLAFMNRQLLTTIRKSKKEWLHVSHSQRKEVRLTKTPLAIMTLFYVFGLPAVFTQLFESIFIEDIRVPSFWLLFLTISNFLVVTNCSTNFIVYCAYGQKFRKTFINLMCCRRPQRRVIKATWHSRTLEYQSVRVSRGKQESEHNC